MRNDASRTLSHGGEVIICCGDVVTRQILAAALVQHGWTVQTCADCLDIHASSVEGVKIVLIVSSDRQLTGSTLWIAQHASQITAVGTKVALPELVEIATIARCRVVDLDQPILTVVAILDRHLRNSATDKPHERMRLQRLLNEQRRFLFLSQREAEVIGLLAAGSSPAEIARDHYVSLATIRSQLQSAFAKLEVTSQLEAVATVYRSCVDERVLNVLRRANF